MKTTHEIPPTLPRLLTVKEVAAALRVSCDTVRRMVKGTDDRPPVLDSYRIEGSVRIPYESLHAYMKESLTRAGSGYASNEARMVLGLPPRTKR